MHLVGGKMEPKRGIEPQAYALRVESISRIESNLRN